MQGKWVYIGGGAALVFAGIVASRSELPFRRAGEASSPPVAAAAPASLSAPEGTAPAPVTGRPGR